MGKIKTSVLLLLVVISMVLAFRLMAGHAVPGRQASYDAVWFGPTPGLHEVSFPSRVFIFTHDGPVQLLETFSGSFTELVVALSQMDFGTGQEGEVWTPVERPTHFPPGIMLRFDYQMTRGLLSSWLNRFHETDFPFTGIDTVFIPATPIPEDEEEFEPLLDPNAVYFINSATNEAWRLYANLPKSMVDTLSLNPNDVLNFNWDWLDGSDNFSVRQGVLEMVRPAVVQVPTWTREEINYNALVRSFYLEPSLTRLIQEPDGAEIYTDGFQALRIYTTGALEYTVVGYQASTLIPGQVEIFEASVDFVASHGGWPGNMLATHVGIKQGGRMRLEFSGFGLGLPILGQNTGSAVELDGLAVSHYSRDLVFALDQTDEQYIYPVSWLLDNPTTQAAQLFATLDNPKITDLSLAYYLQQEEFHPVWRVWLDQRMVFIGATDGRVLNVRTSAGGD